MNWFLISLAATALFGVCNILDKVLITKYFKGGGVGALAIYSALIGFVVVPLALLFDVNYFAPGTFAISLMIISGIGYLLGVIPYLYALTEEDTSSIVPIFQTIPIFSHIFGYFFLAERISGIQYIGMLLIIVGSIIIFAEITGTKIRFRMRPVLLMLTASILISFSNFLFKYVGLNYGFIVSSFWTYMGYALLGVLLLFITSYRKQFIDSMMINSVKILSINTFNEILSVGSKLLQNFATLLAPLALVLAVQGFQPLFVIIYGVILTLLFPNLMKEDIRLTRIGIKVFSVLIILLGGYLIH